MKRLAESASEGSTAAHTPCVGPHVAHPAVGTALLALGRYCERAALRHRGAPLAAQDNERGEDPDSCCPDQGQEDLGLLHGGLPSAGAEPPALVLADYTEEYTAVLRESRRRLSPKK
jgi:hypothetical protein